jgi:hypothetical protein
MQRRSRVFSSLVVVAALGWLLAAAPAGAAEPVGITAIDARAGLVTARDAAGKRTIQFRVTDAALLKSLKVGQTVQADLSTQKVSINYVEPCCNILSVQNGPQPGVTGNAMQNAGGGLGGSGAPPVRVGKDYPNCATCKGECKACADRNMGCDCTDLGSGKWSCTCMGPEPRLPEERGR